jgi:V-type H+-transporting ATPase subunit C
MSQNTLPTQECWLVTIPNQSRSEPGFRRLNSVVSNSGLAKAHELESPQLKVGTLDSLMSLSDELGKHDSSVEMVIRKLERQYLDMCGPNAVPLTVGSASPQGYLDNFNWDLAKYSKRRALPELVSLILSGVGSVDEELKQLTFNISEASQKLATLNRKKGGNLTTTPMEELVTADMATGFIDTEYLQTVCVVVPKSALAEFLEEYQNIGTDIVGYGGPDWRAGRGVGKPDNNYGPFCDRRRETGSPVVPGSLKKLLVEGDHTLFSLCILKGQYEAGYMDEDNNFQQGNFVEFFEPFKVAAREKRFVVREVKLGADSESVKNEVAELEIQVAERQAGLERWCRAHYGEVFSAWIHLKVIRAFVESVLRYGLTPSSSSTASNESNFALAVLTVGKSKSSQLKAAIDKLMNVETVVSDDDELEYSPYCRLEFTIISQ